MIIKSHKKQNKILLAICDDNLLGKKFKEGNKQLDLTGDFYDGESYTKLDAADIMGNVAYLNIVGEKSIELALEEGLIEEKNIIKIDNIPHAQAVILRN